MDQKIVETVWQKLTRSCPELTLEDRDRIDVAITNYRDRVERSQLSPSTRKQLSHVKSLGELFLRSFSKMYQNPEFHCAGTTERHLPPDPEVFTQTQAILRRANDEFARAQVRFQSVRKDHGHALEGLMAQLLYLVCEKKNVDPPSSWPERVGGLRFHEVIRLCVDHASARKIDKQEFDKIGRRVTKFVHETGEEWGELIGPDI